MRVRLSVGGWAAVSLGVLLLVIAAAFLGPAGVLQSKMTQRFLEAEGRTPEQLAARAAEQRQATEARQREQAQEGTRARQERELTALAAEYVQILLRHQDAVLQYTEPADRIVQRLSELARQPSFYRGLTPEEVASRQACDDPDIRRETFRPGEETRRVNGWLCTVHLSLNYPAQGHSADLAKREAITHLALAERTFRETPKRQEYPFPVIVAHVWMTQLAAYMRRREVPPPLPPLMRGNELNPQLLGGTLAPGFVQLLIGSATVDEKVQLTSQTYPDLRRMAELAARIVPLCSALQRPLCLTAP